MKNTKQISFIRMLYNPYRTEVKDKENSIYVVSYIIDIAKKLTPKMPLKANAII